MESYGGDLLPDCYDDWIQVDRERLAQDYQHALERLILLLEEARQYAAAIGYAERLLRADRLREATYRDLMRLHLLNGDRPSALRTYHTCSAMLAQEPGVEPSPATQELYRRALGAEEAIASETAPGLRRTSRCRASAGEDSARGPASGVAGAAAGLGDQQRGQGAARLHRR